MATVTKTFDCNFRGTSITPDGKSVSVSLGWTDSKKTGRDVPGAFTSLTIAENKVRANGVVVGPAPAEISQLATSLSDKVRALVDSLVTSGKVAP